MMVHISYVSLSGTEGLPRCLWALSKVFQNLDYLHWLKMHFLFHFQGFFTKFVLKLWAQYFRAYTRVSTNPESPENPE